MALDPQAKHFVDKVRASPPPFPGSIPIEQFRAGLSAFAPLGFDVVDVAEVRDIAVPLEGGPDVRVRAYRPELDEGRPVVVWAHGGAWVRGNLDSHDAFLRVLASRSGCVVLSVEYRLSPEARFPQALDDVYAVARWAKANATDVGGSPDRIAIGGDSSGANLAAAATLRAREQGDVEFVHQTLMIPMVDLTMTLPAWAEVGDGRYVLSREVVEWAVEQYAPGADLTDPLLSPLHAADHAGLPPALIVSAGCDPLRDDAERYAEALEQAGVAVTHRCYTGMIHYAFLVPKAIDVGRQALEDTADALKDALLATDSGRG